MQQRKDHSLIEQYRLLHGNEPGYGVGGVHHQNAITLWAHSINAKTLLDYGCGKGRLVRALNCAGYDPAINEYAEEPVPADLVFSTDFLEHITEETVDGVLDHFYQLTIKGTWHHINTGKACFHLPDGTNCHTLQRSSSWWSEAFHLRFKNVMVSDLGSSGCTIWGTV